MHYEKGFNNMINSKNLKIDIACFGDGIILTGITPWYEYVDGKKQNKLKGYKYEVAIPVLGFEKLAVKIRGNQQIEIGDDFPVVKFDGLEVTPYAIEGSLRLSAEAKLIEKVNKPQTK